MMTTDRAAAYRFMVHRGKFAKAFFIGIAEQAERELLFFPFRLNGPCSRVGVTAGGCSSTPVKLPIDSLLAYSSIVWVTQTMADAVCDEPCVVFGPAD